VERAPAGAGTGGVGQLELVREEETELDDASEEQCEYDRDQRKLDQGLGPLRTATVRKN
jgi:hypothetical protein